MEPDQVAQLERKIGQQALEIDFLKSCLQSIKRQRPSFTLNDSSEFSSSLTRRAARKANFNSPLTPPLLGIDPLQAP
jgi:hypothetical protein